ncbi:hypothetical protein PVAG01_00364 [Phlyctema vagabunda]|uniref:Uncharacterized protein n=1 Tax=Phlyctema vagabunda TaxID=108571 RepID=A0ABR4PU33_9HELO
MTSISASDDYFKQYSFVWNPLFEERRERDYPSYNIFHVDRPRFDGSVGSIGIVPPPTETIIKRFLDFMCADDPDRFLHQRDQIAMFLKNVDIEVLRQRTVQAADKERKILLDDRNDSTVTRVNVAGACRIRKPLNVEEFYCQLRQKRYDPAASDPDAERRIIYITDIDPYCVLGLAATTPKPQVPILRSFIYKYLGCRSLIGVEIPARGFQTFALEFHLPFYAWRRTTSIAEDSRKAANGKPLRRSEEVIYLRAATQNLDLEDPFDVIYESQISILVSGLDNSFWTAHCFVDTYFRDPDGDIESVEYHCNEDLKFDPSCCGKYDANIPVWSPREYFLRALNCRMEQIKEEWNNAVHQLIQQIEPYTFSFTTEDTTIDSVNELEITQQKGFKWTIRILRQFTDLLSQAIDAWETFKAGEVRYFNLPESEQLARSLWSSYLAAIDKDVTVLKGLKRSLQHQTELFENMTNSLATHAALGASRAALQEARTTRHQSEFIRALTVVTICYLPPSLGTAIFSMQENVLGGHPKLKHWGAVVLGLIAITALLLWVISKDPRPWLWQFFTWVRMKRHKQRADRSSDQRTPEEETETESGEDDEGDEIELQEQGSGTQRPLTDEIV